MNEIYYYEEFSKKFCKYLSSYLGNEFKVFYSCNNTLDKLIGNIERESGEQVAPKDVYVPKLKVDILFAICKTGKAPRLLLIEAKFLNQLGLKDYSQLVGYLQVAKTIDVGLLLLIQKDSSTNILSGDFKEIVRLKKLPMNWVVDLEQFNETYNFKTGIISYIPNNGIDWFDTKDIHGISSFEELVSLISQ